MGNCENILTEDTRYGRQMYLCPCLGIRLTESSRGLIEMILHDYYDQARECAEWIP